MATISPNTLIVTKILISGSVRRFKIPIKDLGANTFPGVLRGLLDIPADQEVIFERFSDSAGQYIVLDSNKPAVYKQLYRAAKAKLKLKIKATLPFSIQEPEEAGPSVLRTLTETTPPAYTSQVTLPFYSASEPTLPEVTPSAPASNVEPAAEPLEKVVSSVVAEFFESDECKTKIRAIVDEGIEKELEKRSVSLNSSTPEAKPATEESHYKPFPFLGRPVYAVYCNFCEANVENVHYHCGICDNGDFDLCQKCKDDGKHCENNDHWLIKRTINNGEITASTSETIRAPKRESKPEPIPVPIQVVVQEDEEDELDRYCNGCCENFPEDAFVRCTICPDFDLCIACHIKAEHGHHPGHIFKPATESTPLDSRATSLLAAGRNFRHFAVCDGCDKQIYGVRHKCLNCPDWDYCSDCINIADISHPGHRFVQVYEALKLPATSHARHYGIYCDGPLCKTRRCIVGDRYKCAICPDFDLCANCEASPTNKHNPTHPLIKFKTPVLNVTVQTSQMDFGGVTFGDRQLRTTTSNASTQVQTATSTEPATEASSQTVSEPVAEASSQTVPEPVAEAISQPAPEPVAQATSQSPPEPVVEATPQSASEPSTEATPQEAPEKPKIDAIATEPTQAKTSIQGELEATFIKDTVRDGTSMEAGHKFTQTWSLFNNGNRPWPAGVTLAFTGGDMFSDSVFDKKAITTVTTQETPAGLVVEFSVELVAPKTSGQHIGYWRLVTADGFRFGPSLWCDIRVTEPKPVVSSPVEVVEVKENAKEEIKSAVKTENDTQAVKPEEVDLLVDSHTSQMIFPTLEKESPMASTSSSTVNTMPAQEESAHEPASPSTVAGLPPSAPSTISGALDDAASDAISFIDDTELEHFLSDEEYDILGGSDDEDF